MAEEGQMSGIDWERELTCSICTDILYQPLALLDCLHTFCGACLKEWFAQQASTATSAHPYTCPSCRASVRGTTRHAWMTSILEQYLKANPTKGKTEEEMEDQKRIYKPGDNVLPKLRRRRNREDETDTRLMDEPARTRERRSRSRSRQSRDRPHRSRESSGSGVESAARPPRVTPSTVSGPPTARQVQHQSSLRSLLSASELDSQELEEEILRQILEEGLLEGIDLDNIDRTQEEQIQERILESFQRRRREIGDERSTSRAHGTSDASITSAEARPEGSSSQGHTSRPPVSRPHLFNAVNDHPNPRTHRRRTSSQGSSRSGRTDGHHGLDVPTSNNRASRSASDLSLDPPRVEGSGERPRRASANTRRTTDPEGQPRVHPAERAMRAPPERRTNSNPASPAATQTQFNVADTRPSATFPIASRDTPSSRTPNQATASSPPPPTSSATFPAASTRLPPTSAAPSRPRTSLFLEPSISCDRCHRVNLQYKLHYACSKCNNGNFHLCQNCFRHGMRCRHWFRYTPATAARNHAELFDVLTPAQRNELPHVLISQRYQRPKQPPVRSSTETARMMTDEDPAKRLEAGVFCDICGAFANACYWKCEICNDGAWGYCNNCANQFRHCTHALLPLAHKATADSGISQSNDTIAAADRSNPTTDNSLHPSSDPDRPVTPKSASPLLDTLPPTILAGLPFTPLTFATKCDVCVRAISPSDTRFHCPDCNNGDYDICKTCYYGLVAKGRIKREDGPHGWRRCPQGHRMGIVGFEDRVGGQWRLVAAERVGGLALKEEQLASTGPHFPSEQRFPPSGGVGLRIHAMYAWWPKEGAKDELMFPKGAEITEADDINGDWCWGCYAGAKGLFPGNYGKVVGRVEG
ncbi:hypothetical protein NA57DRAFT_36958 [Rhizodiscina lignyota]|uniref:RING-type domain-containing protein n=1 Tax=Rhizodiscina lignyota TaxID=1504668 RepID=A0A9P4M7X9_9PEZI|nr:hypothetical protein NA57DRAFT_36958 [Rhizodiscina lignyota]